MERRSEKKEGKYGGIWNESDFGPFTAQTPRKQEKKKVFPDQGEWGESRESRRALEYGQGPISSVLQVNEGKAQGLSALAGPAQRDQAKRSLCCKGGKGLPTYFRFLTRGSYSRFVLFQKIPSSLRATE